MLHTACYILLDCYLLDAFVDNYSNCMLGDVVDNARPAVVWLVWQTFLHGSITLCTITDSRL